MMMMMMMMKMMKRWRMKHLENRYTEVEMQNTRSSPCRCRYRVKSVENKWLEGKEEIVDTRGCFENFYVEQARQGNKTPPVMIMNWWFMQAVMHRNRSLPVTYARTIESFLRVRESYIPIILHMIVHTIRIEYIQTTVACLCTASDLHNRSSHFCSCCLVQNQATRFKSNCYDRYVPQSTASTEQMRWTLWSGTSSDSTE